MTSKNISERGMVYLSCSPQSGTHLFTYKKIFAKSFHSRHSGTRGSLALKELKERTQALKVFRQLKTLEHLDI